MGARLSVGAGHGSVDDPGGDGVGVGPAAGGVLQSGVDEAQPNKVGAEEVPALFLDGDTAALLTQPTCRLRLELVLALALAAGEGLAGSEVAGVAGVTSGHGVQSQLASQQAQSGVDRLRGGAGGRGGRGGGGGLTGTKRYLRPSGDTGDGNT